MAMSFLLHRVETSNNNFFFSIMLQKRHKLHVENGDESVSSEGSDLNKMDSLLAVLSYAVKHHISGVALQDLIDLINLHCPNSLPTSKSDI